MIDDRFRWIMPTVVLGRAQENVMASPEKFMRDRPRRALLPNPPAPPQSRAMGAGRTLGFGLLGAIVGAVLGCALGFGGGLAWITLAGTSDFEGYSGFVVGFWMLAGIILGLVAGATWAIRRSRRPSRHP